MNATPAMYDGLFTHRCAELLDVSAQVKAVASAVVCERLKAGHTFGVDEHPATKTHRLPMKLRRV